MQWIFCSTRSLETIFVSGIECTSKLQELVDSWPRRQIGASEALPWMRMLEVPVQQPAVQLSPVPDSAGPGAGSAHGTEPKT